MLRLLIDQDLDHVILRGLLLRVPNLDVITAHQVGLSNASDPELLAWACEVLMCLGCEIVERDPQLKNELVG